METDQSASSQQRIVKIPKFNKNHRKQVGLLTLQSYCEHLKFPLNLNLHTSFQKYKSQMADSSGSAASFEAVYAQVNLGNFKYI